MRTGVISLFLIVFSGLIGVYIARELFPKVIQKEIIRTILEEATPEIIERVVFDTTYITKWKTRILYKTLTPRSIIEVPFVEIDSLSWVVLSEDRIGNDLSYDIYHLPTKRLVLAKYYVENDYRMRIAQGRATDPLILLESRNLTDIIPHLYIGYNSRYGPEISLRGQRIWKLHLNWIAATDGFHATAFVKIK